MYALALSTTLGKGLSVTLSWSIGAEMAMGEL